MRTLFFSCFFFAIYLVLNDYYKWDFRLQNYFFDGKVWFLRDEFFWPRLFFYDLPKIVLIAGGALLLYFTYLDIKNKKNFSEIRSKIIVMLSLIIIPLIVVWGKAVTNRHCPRDMLPYTGRHLPLGLFESCIGNQAKCGEGRCFPAGHASGGMALISTYFLLKKRKWRGILLGVGFGLFMGSFQIAKGAHFLSHTLATLTLAFIVVSILNILIPEDWKKRK